MALKDFARFSKLPILFKGSKIFHNALLFAFMETYPESRGRHRGPDCRWHHGLTSTDLDRTLWAGLVHREVLPLHKFKMSSVVFTSPSKTFLAAQSWLDLQSSSLTFVYKHACTQLFQITKHNSIKKHPSSLLVENSWVTRYTELAWEKWQTGKFCLQEASVATPDILSENSFWKLHSHSDGFYMGGKLGGFGLDGIYHL